MKKIKWSILLFLILIVVLSSGTPYLALNQTAGPKDRDSKKVHKMTIALVNEDQGTVFQNKKIEFGNQFIKSIEKDETHDWYVVSRGVAESGLKRDIYNMMIIIPSGFSEKALSLTSDSPEKVTLSYKVNTTGNQDLKAEAEKTASSILEDFNRKIIDVFFASILGNLHEAQDNIAKLVKKENAYSSVYNQQVNSPLSAYTTQFKAVQDHTGISKDSFKGLQEILKTFETSLNETNLNNLKYAKSMESLVQLQNENSLKAKEFNEQLGQFDKGLSSEDVRKVIGSLEDSNKFIHSQFQEREDSLNLLKRTKALQDYTADVNAKINQVNANLTQTLESDLAAAVNKELFEILKQNPDGSDNHISLATLTDGTINDHFHQQIQALMKTLPSYEPNDLLGLGLPVEEYANVIELANMYYEKHGDDFEEKPEGSGVPLAKLVPEVKQDLAKNGLTLVGKGKISASENPQKFTIGVDPKFHFVSGTLSLTDDQGKKIPYVKEETGKDQWTLTNIRIPKDTLVQLKVQVKLNDAAKDLDIFRSLPWNWTVTHGKTYEVIDDTEPTPTAAPTTKPTPTAVPTAKPGPEPTATPAPTPESAAAADPAEPTEEPSPSPTVKPTPEPVKTKKEIIYSTYGIDVYLPSMFHSQMQTTAGRTLSTVKNYEKLAQLFQLYYGWDAANQEQMADLDKTKSLEKQATEMSYYHLFNKQDMIGKIVELSTGNLTEALRKKLKSFQQQILDYRDMMQKADQNSFELSQVLVNSTVQAGVMNDSLAQMLKEVETWRTKSMELVGKEAAVLSDTDGEHTATMQLGTEFVSLIAQTEALAESAGANLRSADSVYETFDAIDEQAKKIQSSGEDLIQEADKLALDLAEKLEADNNFSKNFSKVMGNSRIGDRPNEQLYGFLSSPVEKQHRGTIVAGDKTTPYLLVLVCALLTLFTGHVIATQEKKRQQEDIFSEERALVYRNLPISVMTLGVAAIEGIIIGAVSKTIIQAENLGLFTWLSFLVLIMAALVTVTVYLLRQLRMVGMFMVLLVLSLYLFLTDAVGLNTDKQSFIATLRKFSPLQYIETLLASVISGSNQWLFIMYCLIGVAVVGLTLNLFVKHRKRKVEEEHDEKDSLRDSM